MDAATKDYIASNLDSIAEVVKKADVGKEATDAILQSIWKFKHEVRTLKEPPHPHSMTAPSGA